ncbi:glycerate kinase, partial [Oenococcus alcoholitolerans]
ATDGKIISERVTGPLGKDVDAKFGILGDNEAAVIEMSQASGIQYVNDSNHDPLVTTTFGTGQLIISAINKGAKKIILGIGGSATNDGGAGMAQALGYSLLDKNGNEISFGGGSLDKLFSINSEKADPRINSTEILIASDVTNPLIGENGASNVFGPQKGADSEMIKLLDANLKHYAEVIKKFFHKDLAYKEGAGAAGGLGAGLMAFTKSEMNKGVELVLQYTHFKERSVNADFVFTGEGGVDFQTKFGKTPYGVAIAAKEVSHNAPVIVLTGNIGKNINDLYSSKTIDAIFSTPSGAKSLDQAIEDSIPDIENVSENIGRLIRSVLK